MSKPERAFVLLLLLGSMVFRLNAQTATPSDTLHSRSLRLRGSLSGSYTTSRNFQSKDFQNYAINASVIEQEEAERKGRRHHHKLLADLGCLKFIDSLWIKGNDRLQLNLLWSASQRSWTHSYSVALLTQFLPRYEYRYDRTTDRTTVDRSGGMFVPGALELGYGATWYPWPRSSVQFAFATAKINATPKAALQFQDRPHTMETDNTVFDMQYGGSLLVNIDHPINDHLDWINVTKFFCNGFDRDHVAFDLVNKVNVKLFWHLQLRFDTRLGYDPLQNYDLRFSQEILLGIFYDLEKKY